MEKENEQQIERRWFDAEVRVSAEVDHPPMLEGYAAIFNSPSEEIFAEQGWREIIFPGAFRKSIQGQHDVSALVNHNNDQLIGKLSNGTLQLEENEKGLKVRIFPPDTTAGRDILTYVRGKFITKMSFGFSLKGGSQEFDHQTKLRKIIEIGRLYDVSPVNEPAYGATEISARMSLFTGENREISEKPAEIELNSLQKALKEAFLAKIAARQAWLDARTPPPDPFDPKVILKNSLRK
jgi:HK97 family phage prohead protease